MGDQEKLFDEKTEVKYLVTLFFKSLMFMYLELVDGLSCRLVRSK
jgi:hypothetical protein